MRQRKPAPKRSGKNKISVTSTAPEILAHLRSLRSPRDIEGQQRFGIVSKAEQLGLSVTKLREMGRPLHRQHGLAQALWATGVHDARFLAAIIEDPQQVTRSQMDCWVSGSDNWALTDALSTGVFDLTPYAVEKAHRWSGRRQEFVKRAGFALMAGMAVHRKDLTDEIFLDFLPVIEREATDDRNFVRKAVNWALRQIGKRNAALKQAAVASAQRIQQLDSRAAREIAADALRELKARR